MVMGKEEEETQGTGNADALHPVARCLPLLHERGENEGAETPKEEPEGEEEGEDCEQMCLGRSSSSTSSTSSRSTSSKLHSGQGWKEAAEEEGRGQEGGEGARGICRRSVESGSYGARPCRSFRH